MHIDQPQPAHSPLIGPAWGLGPSDRYETLAAPFRPVFARIRAGAVDRELRRALPFEEIGWLKEVGLTAIRVPKESGGAGATLPELFALLVELSQADSNITQALRAHFGFVEHILVTRTPGRQGRWLPRLLRGDIVGAAWSEVGDAKMAQFSTRLTREQSGWRLNGSKFYTTGSLFGDWIHVGASDAEGEAIAATVARVAPGVEVVDDWDGMGQRLTASGTSHFVDVPVEEGEVVKEEGRFAYSQAFYQLVHLATLAGIGRATSEDVAAAVARRQRTYSHAAATRPAEDPQVLQVVGNVRSAAYSAGCIVRQAADALERAYVAGQAGLTDAALAANAVAELETWQAQAVVSDLILNSTAAVYDALGASATLRPTGLDRYWRNARTISSHNPRIYKDRIVGDFAVNGTLPPPQWRIGAA
jgi:alkylation response protein AidB-like acyl-CoA dehydrogenase